MKTKDIPKVTTSTVETPPRGKPRSRVAGALGAAALVAITVVICLVVAEVGLRIAGVKPAGQDYGDPVIGDKPKPHSVQTYAFPEYGPKLVMRINNWSFHNDRDITVAKPPGVDRIVVLGDSQTAGICANSENFPNRMEQTLNTAGGQKYEVWNGGVGKYSPYQYLVEARRDVVPLHPDRIVVVFYMGNDLNDLLRQDDRPYVRVEPDGRVTEHPPIFVVLADPRVPPSMLASSRVYALAHRALGPTIFYEVSRFRMLLHNVHGTGHGPVDTAKYMWDVKDLADISTGLMTQSLHQQVWFWHFPETLQTALELNRNVMQMFQDLCRRNGIQLTYALLPSKVQIEPERLAALGAKLQAYKPGLTLQKMKAFEDSASDRVIATAESLHIDMVDLRPALLAHKASGPLYYQDDMHLDVAGNRVVGETLADYIRAKAFAQKGSRP